MVRGPLARSGPDRERALVLPGPRMEHLDVPEGAGQCLPGGPVEGPGSDARGSRLLPLELMGVWTEGAGDWGRTGKFPSSRPCSLLAPPLPLSPAPLPLHLGTTVGGCRAHLDPGLNWFPLPLVPTLFPLDSFWHDCDPRPWVCSRSLGSRPVLCGHPRTLPPASTVGKGLGWAFCLLAPLAQFLAAQAP